LVNVLFLCTGNSARSILAEALTNDLGAGKLRGYSAGSRPQGDVHPQALELLERQKLPTAGLRSKSWTEFAAADAPVMDLVITVCDNAAAETCPVWPGRPATAHWGVPDPADAARRGEDPAKAFLDACVTLRRRIALLTRLRFEELDESALRRELNRIGQM
jgi:arsenate reductase